MGDNDWAIRAVEIILDKEWLRMWSKYRGLRRRSLCCWKWRGKVALSDVLFWQNSSNYYWIKIFFWYTPFTFFFFSFLFSAYCEKQVIEFTIWFFFTRIFRQFISIFVVFRGLIRLAIPYTWFGVAWPWVCLQIFVVKTTYFFLLFYRVSENKKPLFLKI